MKRTRPWEVGDALWERVQPLIPERPPHPKGGRPAEEDRQMFAAILYVGAHRHPMECLTPGTSSLHDGL
jgi:transposase